MRYTGKPQYDCYARARDATCYECFGELDEFESTHQKHGDGAVRGRCRSCGRWTYFDLEENDPNYYDDDYPREPQTLGELKDREG